MSVRGRGPAVAVGAGVAAGVTAGVTAGVAAAVGAYASRRYFRDWGATKAECHTVLPGDELVGGPADVTTRAVTVDAPAQEVWRWLVQIGQDRGGLYGYDALENLVGLQIHSADEVRPEWQHLAVGDEIRLVPRGWLGLREGMALPVAQVDPGRSIVLRQRPPDQPWDGVWSFHVHPVGGPQGDRQCRLLARTRTARVEGAPYVAPVVAELLDAVTAFVTRRMLLGIKARAERSAAAELVRTASAAAHERVTPIPSRDDVIP